jgi:hypothetical protein
MPTTVPGPSSDAGIRPILPDTCCPPFHPAPWDDATHSWVGRRFVRITIPQVMHLPIGITGRMRKLMASIEAAGAMPAPGDALVLMREKSPWESEVLVAVTKDVPDLAGVLLSGTFFSKVFDGPYRETPQWIARTNEALSARGQRAIRHYVRYAYCPRCMRKYGRNPGVVLAQLA